MYYILNDIYFFIAYFFFSFLCCLLPILWLTISLFNQKNHEWKFVDTVLNNNNNNNECVINNNNNNNNRFNAIYLWLFGMNNNVFSYIYILENSLKVITHMQNCGRRRKR